jgi:hypothetical protein
MVATDGVEGGECGSLLEESMAAFTFKLGHMSVG